MRHLARPLALVFAATLIVTLGGCGGAAWPEIVLPRHVPSPSGPPRIVGVRDMGNISLPEQGPYAVSDADGVAVIGELLLIQGAHFGKQPTVTVGGRPAEVLRRTEDGGVIVRVPGGTPPGKQPVEVANARGRARLEIPVRRLALVTLGSRDAVHVLSVGREAAEPLGVLPVVNARAVRLSPDGSTAYVACLEPGGENVELRIVDLTARGGPRVVQSRKIHVPNFVTMVASEKAPRLALIGEKGLIFLDISDPLRPSHNPLHPFPENITKGKIVAADIDPDGELLALLLAEKNQVAVFNCKRPTQVQHLTTVEVLPDTRLPVLRDLRFSIDGETLWVVSGDTQHSRNQGVQATRLSAIRLTREAAPSGPRLVSVWRTMPVPQATAPLSLCVARGQMVASGTTIRLPPEKAAVFITAIDPALLGLEGFHGHGGRKALESLRQTHPGMLVRADINGGGGPLFTVPEILTGLDITPDAQLILAVAARVATQGNTVSVEGGVLVSPVWAAAYKPVFVSLGTIGAELLRAPFRLGEVRIQP